jgi:hypothetical protein
MFHLKQERKTKTNFISDYSSLGYVAMYLWLAILGCFQYRTVELRIIKDLEAVVA